jgi:hypothetical protein
METSDRMVTWRSWRAKNRQVSYFHALLLHLHTADAKNVDHPSIKDDSLVLGQAQSVSDTPAWLSTYPQLSDEVLPPNRTIKPFTYNSFQLVLEPFRYVATLPSKGIRNVAIDALDIWYRVPEHSLNAIKRVIDMLHSSSLMYVIFKYMLPGSVSYFQVPLVRLLGVLRS